MSGVKKQCGKMRVLEIVTLCELGGAQSVVANIANGICDNHEVIVASGEGDGKMWNMLDERVQRVHCRHLKRKPSFFGDLRTMYDFWKLYRKYRPDIIHLHSSKAGILGRLVFPKKKIVYTVHGFDTVRLANRRFLPLEKMMQHRCSSIVSVSKYDERNLKTENITKNLTTVYNGATVPAFNSGMSFGIPAKYRKTVLCIARICYPKNHLLYMEVAKRLPDYAFVWIGNKEPVESAPENVFFMGNIPNAAIYSSIADLFVLPSNYEGLPIVIIEAMSFGKPVVASNVGGISELVHDGINGYAVENNVDLFVEKIKYILEDGQVYDSMCKASKEIYEKDFTVERMVSGYKGVYNKVLGRECF